MTDVRIINKRLEVLRWFIERDEYPCTKCHGRATRSCHDYGSQYSALCDACYKEVQAEIKLPFPVEITTSSNLRNHLGMNSQWVERTPSPAFFDGLSGRPDGKFRIDFSSHTVYATVERAKKDNWI